MTDDEHASSLLEEQERAAMKQKSMDSLMGTDREWARLRRVEAAAKAFMEAWNRPSELEGVYLAIRALRAALWPEEEDSVISDRE